MRDMCEKWRGQIWVKLDFREKCTTGDLWEIRITFDLREICMTIDLSARSV